MSFAWKAAGISYNAYLAVSARALRRGLKPEKLTAARSEADVRVFKWTNGKQGEPMTVPEASNVLRADAVAAAKSS